MACSTATAEPFLLLSSAVTASPLYRMTPLEVAAGFVYGLAPVPRRPVWRSTPGAALAALEEAIFPSLVDGPCFVSFSGGRDSSAVLAVATALARRHGLPEPVPLTIRYPGVAEADEADWQELVVRHLGLAEWQVVEVGADLDLLGPLCRESLRRVGVVWPPLLHRRAPWYRLARGGWLLTGESGDEIFVGRRITPIVNLVRRRRRPTGAALRLAARAAVPLALRRRGPGAGEARYPWLRPRARAEVARLQRTDARVPLRWDRAMLRVAYSRSVVEGIRNLAVVAEAEGARLMAPFRDESFLAHLAGTFGPLGPRNRTAAMTALFADLLPAALLRRSSKAYFNTTAFREHSRAFVERWDGTGLDSDLVDPDALRQAWQQPLPSMLTFPLLQQAWLATEGRSE